MQTWAMQDGSENMKLEKVLLKLKSMTFVFWPSIFFAEIFPTQTEIFQLKNLLSN